MLWQNWGVDAADFYEILYSSKSTCEVYMTTYVTKELTAMDFRQNYVPEPAKSVEGPNRHWLLDSPAGRDLLKMKLIKVDRRTDVQLFSNDQDADGHLDRMVDQLGLRDLAKPELPMDVLKVNFKLVKLMAAVLLGLA